MRKSYAIIDFFFPSNLLDFVRFSLPLEIEHIFHCLQSQRSCSNLRFHNSPIFLLYTCHCINRTWSEDIVKSFYEQNNNSFRP